MPDLTDLSSVSGEELTVAQIQGILAQIDLDIMNLARDGKLAALESSESGASPEYMDKSDNLHALLAARGHYQRLLESRPGWATSQGDAE
jgi:hypothetical protein